MEKKDQRVTSIKCCLCGIDFNPHEHKLNLCINCAQKEKDDLQILKLKNQIINFCKHCNRYERPPYQNIKRESQEMLALMLKRISGINKVEIQDAKQIWTEEHCRRLKLMIIYKKDGVEENKMFEFIETINQCIDCQKEFTPHKWVSQVQMRQKSVFNKTLLSVEQKLIKKDHLLKQNTVVERVDNGLDIQFKGQKEAQLFINYIQQIVVNRQKTSKQLISADLKSNTQVHKYTTLIELPLLCKNDLIIIDNKVQNQLGGCSQVLLCFKLQQNVRLLDTRVNRIITLDRDQYFNIENLITVIPFINNSTQFIVISNDYEDSHYQFNHQQKQKLNTTTFSINSTQKFINLHLSKLIVADINDMQIQYEVESHIGDKLKCGDLVQGYDLKSLSQISFTTLKNIPDIILVKKVKNQQFDKPKNKSVSEKNINNKNVKGKQKTQDKQILEINENEEQISDIEIQ